VTLRRFLKTAVVLCTGLLAGSFGAIADTGPAECVRTLGNEALGVIRADMAPAQMENFFHQLLRQDFDLPGKARFVLGPYWRGASEPGKRQFRRRFEDYIVRIYSQRFAQYRGETLKMTGSRSAPQGAIVTSEIVRPEGGPPIKVEWRLGMRDGLYKVSDVIIDGVSMGASKRSEFASLIQRSGGQVQGLLAMMRDRATAPASAPQAGLPPSPGSTLHCPEPALSFASTACSE